MPSRLPTDVISVSSRENIMSLNEQVSAERLHIGFFGMRNAGKSSLVNAVTGQDLCVVSETKGTTTDPVRKAMELLPLGPVVIIDTPGLDDEGDLGKLRVEKALSVLNKTDIAVLVTDASKELMPLELDLIQSFKERNISYVIAYNKSDLLGSIPAADGNSIYVSALENKNIYELKELIASFAKVQKTDKRVIADLINPEDVIVLVVPVDSAAPKGRLILPQQQTIRDILDTGAVCMVTRETELEKTLASLSRKPKLVVTDSQVFGFVNKAVPKDIMLTSFSILFADYKGDLRQAVKGAAMLDRLKDGNTVLISEGCTHHRQCEDIGTVKMPAWIEKHTGKKLNFAFTSGGDFPSDMSQYALIVHCGGCMLNEKEMKYRIGCCKESGIPITNYGIAIAHMHGILKRSLEPFPDILDELK